MGPISIREAERSQSITTILNGTNNALKQVVPIPYTLSKPTLFNEMLLVQFGVFIGITGDIKGKLVFVGNQTLFSSIGEVMFGAPLQGEMLTSFSGELGNMVAGNLSTAVVHDGVNIDITAPSIIEGKAQISGHHLAIQLTSTFQNIGALDIYLLID